MAETLRYDIASTRHSSIRLGVCEVCKKHCTEVFMQSAFRWYPYDDRDRALHNCTDAGGWTCHSVPGSAFGHEECLLGLQRGSPALANADDFQDTLRNGRVYISTV